MSPPLHASLASYSEDVVDKCASRGIKSIRPLPQLEENLLREIFRCLPVTGHAEEELKDARSVEW